MAASKAVIEGFAGGVGSLVALLTTYPLKTIYTLQAIRAVKEDKAGASTNELIRAVRDPATLRAALLRHLQKVSTLYAGLQPAAVETAASSAIYFYFYSLLRQAVVAQRRRSGASNADDIGVLASLLIAALAGAGNQLLTSPAAVITTQMQAQAKLRQRLREAGQSDSHIESTTWGVCKQIWHTDGAAGFWKGLVPSLILVVNPAVQYMLYEALVARSVRLRAAAAERAAGKSGGAAAARAVRGGGGGSLAGKLSPGEVFVLGALAKIGATVVTYPMIVIKSRLQAMGSHTSEEDRYGGTKDAITRIYKEEGLPGFFSGMRAKILQTALNAALMLTLKEQVYSSTAAALNTAARLAAARIGPGPQPVAVQVLVQRQ